MQPTRAQVVPASPPLINTKDFLARRTRPMALRPAVPEPMMATSTSLSCTEFLLERFQLWNELALF